MRDRQAPTLLPSGRIPVLSPVLHFISMPVLVFWRRRFGYAYLSPKSVFLSSIFATCLFSFIVWNEPALKIRYIELSSFCLAASVSYVFHLVVCISNEVERGSAHDQYSGSSRLLVLFPAERREKLEGWVHGAIEPALTLMVGLILWNNALGKFLFLSGGSLACKELIRYWLDLRGEKRVSDSMDDARNISQITTSAPKAVLSTTGRTEQEIHARHYAKDLDEESRYAEILRMLPPYTLDDAEANAARLLENIDLKSSGSKEQIRRIHEAIDYFRSWEA